MNEEILTTAEVADLLKVTVPYVYQLKAQRKIPYHKLGKTVRYIKSEIIEWIRTDSGAC